jgi:hypothetical protein
MHLVPSCQHSKDPSSQHTTLFNDITDGAFKAHVQHSIGFIKNQILDSVQTNFASLNKVLETTWGSSKNIATLLKFKFLREGFSTTINRTIKTGIKSVMMIAMIFVK